jgi:ABC-type phosphate transport system substrate-binding protein
MKHTCLFTIIFTLVFAAIAFAGEPVVIVNSGNPESAISKDEIAKIFTGKIGSWSSGEKIKPCDQKFDSEVAKKFISTMVGKSVNDYQAYWMEKMLSGAASPPKSLASDADVIAYVASEKGAIGYIDSGSLSDRVKKLDIK